MKILFAADVPPDWNSGAAGTEMQTIAALRRLGHEVDTIWYDDLPHRIKHWNLHYIFELPQAYREAIRKKCSQSTYDVIHVNQGHAFLAAIDHLRSKRPGVFVCRSHGLDDYSEEVLRTWRRKLGHRTRNPWKALPGRLVDWRLARHMQLAARYASGFVVSSSLDRQFLIERHGMAPERVACIHQAPPDLFAQTPALPQSLERLRRLLYVAGFGFYKAPQVVAAAANALLSKHPEARLTWVCSASDHAAVAQLLSPQARAQTELLAWTSQEELMRIYDQHGIFLFPSFFEGFGKAFLEAMARGLCVIATKTGGMLDIIQHGKNGFLVDLNAADQIIQQVEFLWNHPSEAHAMSEAARATALEFTWDRVGRETAAFYQKLLTMQKAHE